MEQEKAIQPRQKVITILLRTYSQAIQRLKQRNFTQGITLLQSLLAHPYINDSDMENLKFSIYMSLGEVHEPLGQSILAAGYYWEALKLHQKRSHLNDQRQMMNRLQNQDRADEQFTILLKMIFIIEKTQHREELIYLLKRAIKISPSLWRESLLQKLRAAYQKEGKVQSLRDLNSLMQNPVELEEAINEIAQVQFCKIQQLELDTGEMQKESFILKKLCLRLNLKQKDEIMLKYSCWENLLTMIYVLLKCKHSRNFNKKKYLHKKYDESDRDWNQFVNIFSLTKTKIQIKIVEVEEGVQKIEIQNQVSLKYDKMVNDLSDELLKYKYGKKKGKKQANPLQELSRLPSLTSKDPKKVLTTQTKSIYGSIYEYYKQLLTKSNINKNKLKYLSQFNQELFHKIFNRILSDETTKQKGETEENDEEDMEGSMSQLHEANPAQKDVKQKKNSKTKKIQQIERNRLIGMAVIPVLKINHQSQSKQYSNVIELLHDIIECLFSSKAEQANFLLKNAGIRSILQKDILKVLELGQGFFESVQSIQFFELLMEKLQNVIDKDCKTKEFKAHQLNKRNILANYIKQKYLPSTFQIETQLTSSLSLEALKKIANLCENFCKFYSLYQMTIPTQVNFYRDLYIIFKKKYDMLMSQKQLNQKERQKAITYYIDRQIQKHQKKVLSKTAIMTIKDQGEQSLNTVDQIYKKDQEISAVLPILKIFNCHPDQSKATKNTQISQQCTGQVYLQSFVKLAELFFKKIELQSYKEFNSRLLNLLGQIMKLKQVINQLYQKFMQTTLFKSPDISKELYVEALFYLIRIYLLNLYEQSDNCLKISFFLTNLLFKSEQEEKKYIFIPKIIYSFDELIKFKKLKPDMLNSIRKRLYQNLILKNLNCIYGSPLFIQTQEKTFRKKQLKNKMDQQVQMNSQQRALKALEQEKEEIKERIFDLIHDVYFCPEKDREFNPKRIEEAVGYFIYLLKAYHEMFQRKVIQLQNQAIKVFRKCHRLYLQKRDQVYKLCFKIHKFRSDFELFMDGDENKVDKAQFLSIIKQERQICQCCSYLSKTHKFYVQSLFVIGKYYQSQCSQPQLYFTKESWIEDSDKDQTYYFQYLVLNLDKQLAWENILRVNCLKSFYYFDSLLEQPYQKYKNKFLYTKRLIHLINENFPFYSSLTATGLAHLEILNILKIKERQLLMLTKKIKLGGIQNKESRELEWKYKEGMKKIYASCQKYITEDVRIRYLRMSELKIKMIWGNIEKDLKYEHVQQEIQVIIELDDDSNSSKIIHQPSKNIGQIQEIVEQARLIIKDLPPAEETQYVVHLEEDICMQLYVLLAKHFQLKLDNAVDSICSSLGLPHSQKLKKIKQAQFYLSDLDYTLNFCKNGDFLTSNPRYALKNQNMALSSEDFVNIQAIFANIFSSNEAADQNKVLKQEKQRLKQTIKRQPIVIKDEQNEQMALQNQRSRMQQQSVRQKSNSKSVSSKGNAKSKALKLQIGTYIYDKIVQYIISRKVFSQPLNHLQTFLFYSSFQQIVLKMTKILTQISRIITQLPKYQIKKFKNRRSVVISLLYCSHLAIKYTKNAEKPLELIKQYVNMKSDLITNLNLYNDKLCAEKNQLLVDFYNRGIVHQIMKIQFIRHLFQVYIAQANKQGLVLLNKKLLKLSKINDSKPEKQKVQKNVEKQPMCIQGEQGKKAKEAKQKDGTDLNISRQSKQAKENVVAKTLEVQICFFLFCQGVLIFMQMLKKQAEQGEIEEKYQKNLLQFKNKMKKQIKIEQKSVFLAKLQDFLNQYQQKYNKKIKMKRIRKDKQGEMLPFLDEKALQIQVKQKKGEFTYPINFQILKHIQKVKPQIAVSYSQKQQRSQKLEGETKLKRRVSNKVKQSLKKQKGKIQVQQQNQPKQIQPQLISLINEKQLSRQLKSNDSKMKQASKQQKLEKTPKSKKTEPKASAKRQKSQTPVKKKSKQS